MKNKKGFTLIEVIISIAALGVICAVLLRLFVVAGDTNKKAANMQDAQVAVTSTVETLLGAESIDDGLQSLGLTVSAVGIANRYTLVRDSYTMVLDISEEPGNYPGTLYALSVKAVANDKKLAEIETAKYFKGQRE